MQMTLDFQYDEVSRIKEENILTTNRAVSHLHYGYDKMSRLEWVSRDEDGLRDSFAYNFAGELTSASYGLHQTGPGVWGNPNAVASYTYDKAGNRQASNGVGYATNGFNEYTQVGSDAVVPGLEHEVRQYRGITYTYLADTKLSEVTSDPSVGGDHFELGYDALGRTVRRTMNGVRSYSIYDGPNAIVEYGQAGGIGTVQSGTMVATGSAVYGQGVDEVLWRNNNGEHQYFAQDRLGSTVAVCNASGQMIEQYRYDAFGSPHIFNVANPPQEISQTAINNRVLFAGREWVSRFGIYENRARVYHPELGRFMSEDAMGFAAGDTNLFRYCNNSPVNLRDPSGNYGIVVGATTGLITGGLGALGGFIYGALSEPGGEGYWEAVWTHTWHAGTAGFVTGFVVGLATDPVSTTAVVTTVVATAAISSQLDKYDPPRKPTIQKPTTPQQKLSPSQSGPTVPNPGGSNYDGNGNRLGSGGTLGGPLGPGGGRRTGLGSPGAYNLGLGTFHISNPNPPRPPSHPPGEIITYRWPNDNADTVANANYHKPDPDPYHAQE